MYEEEKVRKRLRRVEDLNGAKGGLALERLGVGLLEGEGGLLLVVSRLPREAAVNLSRMKSAIATKKK